jgi:hypothetical protein
MLLEVTLSMQSRIVVSSEMDAMDEGQGGGDSIITADG